MSVGCTDILRFYISTTGEERCFGTLNSAILFSFLAFEIMTETFVSQIEGNYGNIGVTTDGSQFDRI